MKDESPETNKSFSIPIIEEEAKVEKKVVEKGKMKIYKTVKEETESLNLPVIMKKFKSKEFLLIKLLKKRRRLFGMKGIL